MGNLCRRRAPQLDDNEGWELVPGAPVAANLHAVIQNRLRTRFRKAVKYAIKILFIRRHWAAIGRYLDTPASRLYPARRNVLSQLWSSWRQQYILRFSHVFSHLKRNRGVLEYK
jgi:hypothetical protein